MIRVKALLLILLMSFTLTCILIMKVWADSSGGEPGFTIRQIPKEVVLYTICRGPYDKVGPFIGSLYALAGKNGVVPGGPPYYVYLNNPTWVSSEHYLTEIRIPVSQDALRIAGTLGPMTDVKSLPATDLAVAVKPEGLADPSTIYSGLYKWIFQQGYIVVGAPREIFMTNAMSGDYAAMKSQILIPVQKLDLATE